MNIEDEDGTDLDLKWKRGGGIWEKGGLSGNDEFGRQVEI
jgi:hypothetical protein